MSDPLEGSRVRHLRRDSVRVVAEIPPGTTVTVMASSR
jgi:hypothetical protein